MFSLTGRVRGIVTVQVRAQVKLYVTCDVTQILYNYMGIQP